MTEPTPLRAGQVFVPGGLPTVTYNPRAELHLESKVQDYLDERHKIFSISGPTKSGKTVLMQRILPDNALWLSGGAIESADGFWDSVVDGLGLFNDVSAEGTSENGYAGGGSGEISVGFAKSGANISQTKSSAQTRGVGRQRSSSVVARQFLKQDPSPIIVIDDFHYISAPEQLKIVRSLKDLIFSGLAVIVAAVPHRAYDVVRVEREMTGRVQQLEVGFWSDNELRGIAEVGFDALNLSDLGGSFAERLAVESFQSPHLMQDFCLAFCKENGVRERPADQLVLSEPNWEPFFQSRASETSKSAFTLLSRGPRQRSDRKVRRLKTGSDTDIYGAVLAAIAKTGPLTEVTYEQLRSALREVLDDEAPQRHEVTRVLEEMAKIAREDIEGEPVVDYDSEYAKLFISDPFFAYYLRWGVAPSADPL